MPHSLTETPARAAARRRAPLGLALRLISAAALVLGVVSAAPTGRAAIMRYALVVGTNHGQDADGLARSPLRHAEEEARHFQDALIARCGFTKGPRTQLLQGPTKAQLLAAIRAYRTRIEADRREFPDAEALFVLFFSGHGADQSVLLRDGPVTGRELVAALADVGADLQVRIFDACSSASLADDGPLSAKGMNPTNMFNLIPNLPDEALNATGEVWFFSAAEGETAFEHNQLGGLFTHALIEAMSSARADEFGISLDAIWDFARARTTDLAAQQGRVQTPTRVLRMRSTGPLHLAWLSRPRATLILGPEISGTLGLFYAGDQMLTIDKSAGTTVERSVYPGTVNIMVTKGGNRKMLQRVEIAPGDRVFVSPTEDARPLLPFGRDLLSIREKGGASGPDVAVSQATVMKAERDATTLFLGAEYRFASGSDLILAPRNVLSATARLEHGAWLVRAGLGYGFDGATFPSWTYSTDALVGSLDLGYGIDAGPLRVTPGLAVLGGPVWESFDDGATQSAWAFAVSATVTLALPVADGVAVEASADAGVRTSRGLALGAAYHWTPAFGFGLGITFQVF